MKLSGKGSWVNPCPLFFPDPSLLLPWAIPIAEPTVTDTYPSLHYSSRLFSICLRGLWPPSWETSCFLSLASSETSGKLLSAHFFTVTGSVSFFCFSSGLWLKMLIQSECNQSTGLCLSATVMELPCHTGQTTCLSASFSSLVKWEPLYPTNAARSSASQGLERYHANHLCKTVWSLRRHYERFWSKKWTT